MTVHPIRQHAFLVAALAGLLVPFVGCGGSSAMNHAAGAPQPLASSKASGGASVASSASSGQPAAGSLCERVCSFQLHCGDTQGTCGDRCRTVERVLQREVIETMVKCVESRSPVACTPNADEQRRQLVGQCTMEATSTRQDETRVNIELFAQAYCKRTSECGVEGTFNLATCMGSARGSIMALQSGGLYGALRPEARDRLVACLGAECSERRTSGADADLDRCLDIILAAARQEGTKP